MENKYEEILQRVNLYGNQAWLGLMTKLMIKIFYIRTKRHRWSINSIDSWENLEKNRKNEWKKMS